MTGVPGRRVPRAGILLAAYLVAVLVVTLLPWPVDRPASGLIQWLLGELYERGMPGFISYRFVEFTANIVFFAPVGLLGALLLPRRLAWLVVAGVVALSSVLEGAQGVFLVQRTPSLLDVLANSAGGLLGVLLAGVIRRAARRGPDYGA